MHILFSIEFGVKGQHSLFKMVRQYKWDYFYYWMCRVEFELLEDIYYGMTKFPANGCYDEYKLRDLAVYLYAGIRDAEMRKI